MLTTTIMPQHNTNIPQHNPRVLTTTVCTPQGRGVAEPSYVAVARKIVAEKAAATEAALMVMATH